MKLIVGLGNPGKEYENTRHNVGFMAIDNYLCNVIYKEKMSSMYYEKIIDNEKVIFIKPLTFMNESGIAVRKYIDYYKINIDDILVIYDDMDYQVGKYKIKMSGSSAGHNGIKSIISNLGTSDFKRIRIGISKPKDDIIDYVLGKFNLPELEEVNKVLNIVNNIIDDFFKMDFEKLMSKYN